MVFMSQCSIITFIIKKAIIKGTFSSIIPMEQEILNTLYVFSIMENGTLASLMETERQFSLINLATLVVGEKAFLTGKENIGGMMGLCTAEIIEIARDTGREKLSAIIEAMTESGLKIRSMGRGGL